LQFFARGSVIPAKAGIHLADQNGFPQPAPAKAWGGNDNQKVKGLGCPETRSFRGNWNQDLRERPRDRFGFGRFLIVCLALMLAFIVRFNEAAPPAICAGAVVFIIFLIRSYRKNRYWSGK
jgi:hypothetical protein